MRSYAWLLFAVIAMSGCALWLGIPGLNGPPGLVPAASTLQNRDTIDVTSMLHTAVSIPERIDNLERSVVVCTVLLGLIGIVNAALLTWMVISRRRVAAALPVAAATPAVAAVAPSLAASLAAAAPPPATAPATVAFCAFCACGAAISARTKTGRCRACALDHRETVRARTRHSTHAESNGRAVALPL